MFQSPRKRACALLLAGFVLCRLSWTSLAAEGPWPDMQVRTVLERIGTRGICVLLGLPRPDFAVELARGGEMLLYVQSPDAQQVQAARQAAEAAGLLGQRIFVDQGPWSRIQLASNLADVILVAEAARGPDGVSNEELLRALRPGGKALLGDKEITRPAPAGTDWWTHPYHGPDNNPLSSDQAARAPYLTQFLAEPLFSSQPEVTVAAGGRIFKAFGHMTFRAYQNPMINSLYAINGYNGTILWKRELKAGFMIHRNTMIATPQILYLADDESCKLMDAATGDVKDQIIPQENLTDGPVWKWMAIEDGVLYALLGPKETAAPVAKGTETRIGGWPWGMWPGYDYGNPNTAWGFGRTFLAIELKSKKVLWNHREEEPLDSRGLCMRGGRIYFYCPDKFLGCLDAKTGTPVWKASEPSLLGAIGANQKAQQYITGFATSAYMKCNDRMLLFAGPQRKALAAVSAEDGKLLWQKQGGNYQLVLRSDALYAMGDQMGKSYKLDYATGNVLAEFPGRRACTRATGTVDSVFVRATEGTMRWDMASNTLQHVSPMRPACHDGVIVSDGLLYWGPWICGCHLTLVGIICLGPAGDYNFQPQADESQQLARARADLDRVKELPVDGADWPTYQGNNQRTRQTKVATAPKAALRWEYKPGSGSIATAPVAAGGLAFTGGCDGIVRAIDATTGQLRWKAYTGGSILFPPAIAEGRAYVGSGDGRVYAFEAATGALLWRFRAAPVERKIPVYGELASTWPVAGGVVVADGVVYAAAGIAHYDGTHVYALDAVTGSIKWHNNSSGTVDPQVKNGISLCGGLRLEGGELSFPGGNVYPTATYDVATGKCRNRPAGARTSRRIFHLPRSLWEPIEADEHGTPLGRIRIQPARGSRQTTVAMHAEGAAQPAWSISVPSYHGSVVAGNTLLLLAGQSAAKGGSPLPHRLLAIRIDDGSELWSGALPAAPVHWGLAVDSQARVFVSLEDGRVLCFAAEGK